MLGFLESLLIFILVIYILRKVLGYILRRYMSNLQRTVYERSRSQQNYQNNTSHPEGETYISSKKKTSNDSSNIDDKDGEYVDYEEI